MDVIYFLVIVCGIVLASLIFLSVLLSIIRFSLTLIRNKLETKLIARALKDALKKTIFLRVEEHSNMQFAYDAITSKFIAQGKDIVELNINFGKSFPNFRGVIVKAEDAVPNVV